MSKRNYDPKYIKYGFTSIEHNAEILPQCVVRLKTLCNAAMKPSLLKRQMQQKTKNVVAASYEIALLVAKQKQPHTIAESLIPPSESKQSQS